jgi:predicted kinase
MIVSPSPAERDSFALRRIEDRSSLLSLARVRELLAGRVGEGEIEAKAAELLDAAARKRLEEKLTVVIAAEGMSPEERERWARAAAEHKRSAHLILLDIGAKEASDEDRAELNKLRSALDAGELGAEGFQTALRLSGAAASEVKRIVFAHPPRDD